MVSFSQLEDLLRCLLARYLSKDDEAIGMIIGSNLSFAALRATIVSLHVHLFGEDDPSTVNLRQMMTKARQIEEERNRIIHSDWGYYANGGTASRNKATARERRGYELTSDEYSEHRLDDFAASIRRLTRDSVDFNPWGDD